MEGCVGPVSVHAIKTRAAKGTIINFFIFLNYPAKLERFDVFSSSLTAFNKLPLILGMRRLAAIMFADMAGYTALMQENEFLANRKRQRLKEVLDKTVNLHHGTILQYYGDGSLTIFNSAIHAVTCATEIQQQLAEEPRVELRIGIHTGDISIEEDSVYGDGVNIASRIESLAVPGSILVSEKVFDDLKNQQRIQAREIGYFELKNVKQPVLIFAISNQGLVVPGREELKGKTSAPSNRLAVLPFVNMSADPENEYFSDGITEELLNALTKVDGLQVTSRTSAFAFKGKHSDIREIGTKLNVDKVLEGSVRKAGNRVRITAQLINASDGYHIWSENYDRDLTDIFEVQDEISGIIANRLRENLSPEKQNEPLVRHPTQNVEAYTFYLKGLHFWNKLTPADAYKAIENFEKAISLEPNYAQAYAMIAGAYSYLGSTGQLNPAKAFEIVHRNADKALQLDDSIAESHMAKASAYLFYEWKWEDAFQALQKAITLNPATTEAYQLLSTYYIVMRKKEEAVKVLENALKLDPLSPIINYHLAEAYIFNEQYMEAEKIFNSLLESDPRMRIAIEGKGWVEVMKGNLEKAREYFEEVHRLTGHPLKGLGPLGYIYGRLGRKEDALEVIRKIALRQEQEPDTVLDGDFSMVYWGMGDRDKVFYHLSKAAEKRMGVIFFLEYPMMRGVLEDPRVETLLKEKFSLSFKKEDHVYRS
jgi:TolB-like protein/class 3 adenylate cyclase/Tfp pilus assembly protein PilF